MKLFKSLLLASATGLVAVSGASAADLGAKKPSPVEYVKACYNPLWGTSGGFVIPGTQTCLRVGGQARFEIGYGQTFQRNAQPLGYRGGGNIFLDAITPSEYGNVRAFVNMSLVYRTGNQRTGTGARWGQSIDVAGFSAGATSGGVGGFGSAAGTDFGGSSGFIQFAGFTFGRTASFFNALGYAPSIMTPQFGSGPGNVNQVAYTANLGNGFLATIAIEDPTTRRNGIADLRNPFPAAMTLGTVAPSGNRMPNLVAAFRLDQAWGSAELSGVAGEIRSSDLSTVPPLGAALTRTNATSFASTKYGYSIAGGLKINLPMIAAGDALFVSAVYTDGFASSLIGLPIQGSAATVGNGGVTVGAFDATVNPVTGALNTTKGWGVNLGFQHFWTPTVSTSITGGYAQVSHANFPAGGNLARGFGNYNMWAVGLLNSWTPVRGLTFALDLAYLNVDPRGRVNDANTNVNFLGAANNACNVLLPAQAACRQKGQDGVFSARFRVVRDF